MGLESVVNKCCRRQNVSQTCTADHKKTEEELGWGSSRNVWNFETGRGEEYPPPKSPGGASFAALQIS